VLHLAAHGVFEFRPGAGDRPVSGLVLDGGTFLTAAEAAQLRAVPELVFVNCCHLGQTRGDAAGREAYHRLAANLATEFIARGARAVVAAGWAVDDRAAQTFATAFYEEMFGGHAFGEAVALARERTFDRHGDTNSWGAYQCYGDVAFALARAADRPATEPAASPAEVGAWAEALSESARDAAGRAEPRARLLEELRAGLATMPASWWSDPRLAAAVGEAFGELDQFDEAARCYDTVARAERAEAPLRALEQCAALRVRHARALLTAAPPDAREAARLNRSAERLLTRLLAIGRTSRRTSLLVDVYDQRVAMTSGAARRRARQQLMRLRASTQ
jgi:hypothetical protein